MQGYTQTEIRKTRMKGNSGFTLVEVMLAVLLLSITTLIFAVTFPTSQISRIKATHMSYAVSLAQQKMEEFRSAGYTGVQAGDPIQTPLAELPGGVQQISITQYASHIKKIEVSITWSGYRQVGGAATLATLISDHN